jgi:hypothetical protein
LASCHCKRQWHCSYGHCIFVVVILINTVISILAWQILGSLDSFGRCTSHEQSLHAVQVPAHGRQYQGGIATICDANKSPAMPSDVSKSTVAPWPNSVAAHSASPPAQATNNALPNALLEECAI